MERLKILRKRAGMTQQEIATKLGVDRSTYTKYETGQSEPTFETLQALSNMFDVNVDFLMGGSGRISNKSLSIPVLGDVAAGLPIEAIENIIDYEEITKELAATGEFFALRLRGDSMAPRMCAGDVVIVKRQSDAETGDVAVVLVNGDSATVKTIKKERDGIWLIPNNPAAYTPKFYSRAECIKLPLEIIGIVVELRAKFGGAKK